MKHSVREEKNSSELQDNNAKYIIPQRDGHGFGIQILSIFKSDWLKNI